MEKVTILQPKNCDFSAIKHQFEETEEHIIDTATYPNGFVMKTTQTADSVSIWTSRPLVKLSDDMYQIPD